MILKKEGRAGGLESGDAMVTARPNPQGGVQVDLESVLKTQFGDSILETARRAGSWTSRTYPCTLWTGERWTM